VGLGSAWGQDQQPATGTSQTASEQASQPAQKQPQWKDRAEYDLVQSALKETNPQKKLELLNQWKEKYPETDFKEMRLEAYIDTYQALNQRDKMFDTAKELLALNPKSLKALYWISVLSVPGQTSPEGLDLAQKAANGLLDAEKPAQVPQAQWDQSQAQMAVVAHRTLGWVAMQRKDYANAQKEFTAELKAHPGDSEAVYWLASVLRSEAEAEKKPELFTQALFFFARAAAYDGSGSFDPTRRKQLEGWLQKAYTTYHGEDAQGFQQLLATAKTDSFPPEGFKILSAAEVTQQRLEQLKETNPAMALWVIVKQELTGSGGDSYFNDRMKGALVPPEGQPAFKAKIVSQEPARAPKVLVVSIEDGKTPDATLRLDTPMLRPAEPGTEISFRGVATSFTAQPFMVTFEVDRKNVTGWPAPPPARRPPVHRSK
jgi:tetratricopeptide (TPR) repeat protein